MNQELRISDVVVMIAVDLKVIHRRHPALDTDIRDLSGAASTLNDSIADLQIARKHPTFADDHERMSLQRAGVRGAGPKMERGPTEQIRFPVRETVCRVAKNPPQQLAPPFTTWSLSKLVEYLAEHKNIRISTESVRQILRAAGVRWQAAKTRQAVEGQQGPGLCREDRPGSGPVRPSASRRPGNLC